MLQIFVDVAQREVGGDVVGRLVDGRSDRVGRRQIDMVLIGVAREQ